MPRLLPRTRALAAATLLAAWSAAPPSGINSGATALHALEEAADDLTAAWRILRNSNPGTTGGRARRRRHHRRTPMPPSAPTSHHAVPTPVGPRPRTLLLAAITRISWPAPDLFPW